MTLLKILMMTYDGWSKKNTIQTINTSDFLKKLTITKILKIERKFLIMKNILLPKNLTS